MPARADVAWRLTFALELRAARALERVALALRGGVGGCTSTPTFSWSFEASPMAPTVPNERDEMSYLPAKGEVITSPAPTHGASPGRSNGESKIFSSMYASLATVPEK